jgi:hypothetical protein
MSNFWKVFDVILVAITCLLWGFGMGYFAGFQKAHDFDNREYQIINDKSFIDMPTDNAIIEIP